MTSVLCSNYLKLHATFDWFIERYYGIEKVNELWDLAKQDREWVLKQELEKIWYELPDSTFNIYVKPTGYTNFLSLIDD